MSYKLMIDGKLVLSSDPESSHVAVDVVQGKKMAIRFEYSQPDNTGQHPSWSLQWSLQGAHPQQDAIDAVSASDATVCVVGGATSETSGEGVDRASLGLPGAQLDFLKAAHATALQAKKPFAVVVVQGKAFAEPWMKQALPAILEAWQSGQAQGVAVAETLFGHNNPAGRAAVTFPASADMLPVFCERSHGRLCRDGSLL